MYINKLINDFNGNSQTNNTRRPSPPVINRQRKTIYTVVNLQVVNFFF